MEINCQISSDLDILNNYNKSYPWIPNSEQIRPTDMNIFMKERLINNIKRKYYSTRDYILIELFYFKSTIKNNKLSAIEIKEKTYSFNSCIFRYKLNPKTFHYILWYNCDKNVLSTVEINNDIKNNKIHKQ